MAKKRKYLNFIFECVDEVFDTGENFYESHEWRAVFTSYMRRESATIYGLPNYDGANYEVIMSK